MNKSILLAGICAVAAVALPTTQASANAFTQTNTMRASANLGRIVNLAVTTNRALSFGNFRYFASTTSGVRYYGHLSSTMSLSKSAADTFSCSGSVNTWHNVGTFEVDQTGTVVPGLVVVKGEPNYQVRIAVAGSDVDVGANTVTLRNGESTVDFSVYETSVWARQQIRVSAQNGLTDRIFSNLNSTVWTTDADGNIALCVGGHLRLPGDSNFADGTYSGTVDFTFSYE